MTKAKSLLRKTSSILHQLLTEVFITIVIILVISTTTCLAESSGYGISSFNKPMEPGQYYTAKDYWKAKRDALKKGNKKYDSAAHQPKKEDTLDNKSNKSSTNSDDKSTKGNNSSETASNTEDPYNRSSASATNYTTSEPTTIPEIYSGQVKTMEEFELSSCKQILKKAIGAPYAESGQSFETGFSSTGLISYIFTNLGYKTADISAKELWRSAGLFSENTLGEAKTGDILFFKLFSKKEGKSKISVAICFDTNEMIYPSFTAKKVIKRSSRNTFWRSRYLGSKRILTGK